MNSTPSAAVSSDSATPRDVTTRLYAAIADGDNVTITRLLHPDATLIVPGTSPVSGRYHGSLGLRRFITATTAVAPGGARTEVIDIMGGDRHAAVHGISRATRPGRPPLVNLTVHLVTVEDGRVTAISVYNSDQSAVDGFWN